MLDGHKGQRLHGLRRRLQGRQRHLYRLFGVSGQIDVDAIGPHPGLKILQLGIDKPVPHDFLLIDIEEFSEDRVEGVGQRRDVHDFHAVLSPGGLHTKIRVDQGEGLHRKILRLQIPGGMIGGDMADVGQIVGVIPQRRVVIVHKGHLFIGLAAEFAQIMAGRGARQKCQVYGGLRR